MYPEVAIMMTSYVYNPSHYHDERPFFKDWQHGQHEKLKTRATSSLGEFGGLTEDAQWLSRKSFKK